MSIRPNKNWASTGTNGRGLPTHSHHTSVASADAAAAKRVLEPIVMVEDVLSHEENPPITMPLWHTAPAAQGQPRP